MIWKPLKIVEQNTNARRDYFLEFLKPKLDENSKYLFNHIKRMNKDVIGIEALKFDGKLTTDPAGKAEALARQYESVFVRENLETIPNILPSPYPDMAQFDINENGVKKQLEELNIHKSVGPDDLSPHLLNFFFIS